MRDVILAQLDAARAVLVQAGQGPVPPATLAAGLACHDAAAALVSAWGNLDEPLAPEASPEYDTGVCRHKPEQRTSTATHGDPRAWMCLGCGFNGTDSAPTAQNGG